MGGKFQEAARHLRRRLGTFTRPEGRRFEKDLFDWSEVSLGESSRRCVGELGRTQSPSFVTYGENLELHSRCQGKPLENFMKRNDVTEFTF